MVEVQVMLALVVADDSVDVLVLNGQFLMVAAALQRIPALNKLGHLFVEFGVPEWSQSLPALVLVPEDCPLELQVGHEHRLLLLAPNTRFSLRRMPRPIRQRHRHFSRRTHLRLTQILDLRV